MLRHLFFLLLPMLPFAQAWADEESSEEIVQTINMADGALYRNGNQQSTGWVSQWISTQKEPFQLSLTAPANNIDAANCKDNVLKIAPGQVQGNITIAVDNPDYQIYSYQFTVTGGGAQSITPAGQATISLTAGQTETVDVKCGRAGATFGFAGTNVDATFTDITVTIRPRFIEEEPQTNLFEYGSAGNTVCYRIPAIATAQNGNVIAVADYRYGGADIGFGRVSLRYRVSKDNGQTWGEIQTLQESRQGQYGVDKADDLWAGFGDPCIVADRESSRVLALSCCGNVSYPAGTWKHHQGIARFRSEDNGETWTEYPDKKKYGIACHWEDISPDIYQQFKDGGVEPAAMFVGSGRIFQSRFTKVGQYYRLYCVVLLRTASQSGLNYVLFSDDFGDTWKILGGDNFTYGVSGGDEPKAEELPDGSVLLSSRAQGRILNIFHFSDVAKGEGQWMTQALSNGSNNGIREEGNACNGEIMILPAIRQSDQKKLWLALQSVPFGPGGRCNVGIYYKPLDSYAAFASPAALARDWEGRYQVSYMSSAYSTMTLQHDGHIGFLYEESTFGKDYTIVYKNYPLETITDGAYSLDPEPVNPFELTRDGVEALTSSLTYSSYVGGLLPEAESLIAQALATFKAEPVQANYLAIFDAISNAPAVPFDPAVQYILRNTNRGSAGAYAMCVNGSAKLMSKAYNAEDSYQQWTFIPGETDGYYYIYNPKTESYVTNLPAVEKDMTNTKDAAKAGEYRLQRMGGDHFALINRTPANATYPAIHAPGAYTTRMVCWTAEGEASQWFIEPTDLEAVLPDAIHAISAPAPVPAAIFDLQGRPAPSPRKGVFIVGRKKLVKH